jgi:hypothetical protein
MGIASLRCRYECVARRARSFKISNSRYPFRIHVRARRRRARPELMQRCPSRSRGRREDRVLSAHPRPVCVGSKHTVVTTGRAGSSGLPCAMVLTAYIALSPGTGLFCPRHFRENCFPRKLSASVGAPGPHNFAVRNQCRSSRDTTASTASHPAFVTTRTPLLPRRDGAKIHNF